METGALVVKIGIFGIVLTLRHEKHAGFLVMA